jgi:uroporphyrinogen-III synthase
MNLGTDLPLRPLQGKRVVVTRAKQTAEEPGGDLAAQLQNLGAIPVVIPAIQLVPAPNQSLPQTLINQLAKYDWIIFTSANAVSFFWSQAAAGVAPSVGNHTRVAAVGPATRAALQALGISVDAMPEKALGVEIAAALGDIEGKHILLPRSARGGHELPAALMRGGATVDDIALYTPTPAPIDEAARTELAAGVDVIVFASGSAASAFPAALRADARFADFWSRVVVACIGPATAEVTRAEGLPVHIIAAEHTASGLVTALVAYFEQGA